MKKLLFGLLTVLYLSGCAVYFDPSEPNVAQYYGTVTVCDDYGCREVRNVQYRYGPDGTVYYWDIHFGAWIGPRGYWHRGSYYRGPFPSYHEYYHHEYYHRGFYHGGRHR